MHFEVTLCVHVYALLSKINVSSAAQDKVQTYKKAKNYVMPVSVTVGRVP